MHRTLSAFLLAIAACAGGEDGEDSAVDTRLDMTCEVMTDTGNCWAVAADEAYACVPETDLDGTFDSVREVCTLGSGITVVFDEPVPPDPFADSADDYMWSFTIMSGGSECARFEDSFAGYVLTTESGTANAHAAGITGLELECPNGDVYYTSDYFDLWECEGDMYGPGYSYSGNVSFGILGATIGRSTLWNCQ